MVVCSRYRRRVRYCGCETLPFTFHIVTIMGPITNESEVYTSPYRGYRFALQAGQQPTNSYTEHRKGHAMYAGVTKYGIYIYIYMCVCVYTSQCGLNHGMFIYQ